MTLLLLHIVFGVMARREWMERGKGKALFISYPCFLLLLLVIGYLLDGKLSYSCFLLSRDYHIITYYTTQYRLLT